MPLPFRPTRRRALLDEYFSLLDRAEDSDAPIQRLLELAAEYERGLPRPALSRCPYTGFELLHSFDPYGLDGLWWNALAPVRPLLDRLYTCQALTGAVSLNQPLEHFPFLAKPGPAVPYVIPELFDHPGVRAVLSVTTTGPHTAFVVAYFTPDELDGPVWPNDWATDRRWSAGGASPPGLMQAPPDETRWSFDLAPWLASGRLQWIAPHDPSLTLRSGPAGCPYLNLAGERRLQRVSGGQCWFAETEETYA